jgi:hypothetical protein
MIEARLGVRNLEEIVGTHEGHERIKLSRAHGDEDAHAQRLLWL